MAQCSICEKVFSYDGDGKLLRLGLQAYLLGIAYEFDPYFGLSVSKVDPLPHQLEAVYDYLLKLPRVRFLLADDAGAGKTIMAGLLIRQLRLRGLAERILVVCPANLCFQWQRELKEKFDEKFLILKGGDIREQFGVNQWLEQKKIITSLDLAKRTEILPGLRQVHWDLVIVDEAHRMSWTPPARKTARYALGELLRDSTDHMLLLTAMPHKGYPENFRLFLQLLDRDAYADVRSIHEAMAQRRAPFYLRRTKEAMVYFLERRPDGTWVAKKNIHQAYSAHGGISNRRGGIRSLQGGLPFREAPKCQGRCPRRCPPSPRGRLPDVPLPAQAGFQETQSPDAPGAPGADAGATRGAGSHCPLPPRGGRVCPVPAQGRREHAPHLRARTLALGPARVRTLAGLATAPLAAKYPRCSTDRETAERHHLEWVTPGHPLFEAIRRHTLARSADAFAKGACFYSLTHDTPARIDFYRARVVDGQGQVVHERLFAVELRSHRRDAEDTENKTDVELKAHRRGTEDTEKNTEKINNTLRTLRASAVIKINRRDAEYAEEKI